MVVTAASKIAKSSEKSSSLEGGGKARGWVEGVRRKTGWGVEGGGMEEKKILCSEEILADS